MNREGSRSGLGQRIERLVAVMEQNTQAQRTSANAQMQSAQQVARIQEKKMVEVAQELADNHPLILADGVRTAVHRDHELRRDITSLGSTGLA